MVEKPKRSLSAFPGVALELAPAEKRGALTFVRADLMAMVRIEVPEAADVLGLVAPHFAVKEAGLGALGALGTAGGEAASLVEAVGLEEAAQRCIGRYRLEGGVALGKRDEIVVVQLHAPALVRRVLGDQRLA